ncbi:MAG: HNH/ENDO VII family nuclease, partial [Alphaproteobacteria bacterium]
EMATRVLGEVAERAALEGRGFSQKDYETALKEAAEVAKNVGQIGAASVALLSRQEVGTAIHTAQNATENNLVPGLIAGGLVVWSAYEIMEIARTQGKDAALKAAGIEIGTFVVGGVVVKGAFKVGKVAYKSAEAAWFAYVAENPIMAKLGNTVASAVERGKSWVGGGVGKISQKAPSRNVALEALDLESPKIPAFSSNYWKKSDMHTFRGQTNRVHKRDDLIDLSLKDFRGRTNAELMKAGRAPIGSDGNRINLHHLIQTQDGALAEVSGTMHSRYHKTLHIWSNQSKGGVTRAEILPKIDRAAFDTWKADYWKARVAELEKFK